MSQSEWVIISIFRSEVAITIDHAKLQEMSHLRKESSRLGKKYQRRQFSYQKMYRESKKDQEDRVPYEEMASLMIISLITFVIFIHCMASWERSQR